MKTLTKSCHCAVCGAKMEVGTPFDWFKIQSHYQGEWTRRGNPYRPCHAHDCVAEKAQRIKRQSLADDLRRNRDMLRELIVPTHGMAKAVEAYKGIRAHVKGENQ